MTANPSTHNLIANSIRNPCEWSEKPWHNPTTAFTAPSFGRNCWWHITMPREFVCQPSLWHTDSGTVTSAGFKPTRLLLISASSEFWALCCTQMQVKYPKTIPAVTPAAKDVRPSRDCCWAMILLKSSRRKKLWTEFISKRWSNKPWRDDTVYLGQLWAVKWLYTVLYWHHNITD